uniref:Endoglucanase n=1 Tax=Oryza brachyantha TaxID=4533 RepID=J3MSR1_ORYBR
MANMVEKVLWVATMVLLMCLAGAEEDGGVGLLGSPDYGDALAKAILFFEGQGGRGSGRLPASQRATWRGDSALTDGREENVNLTGGYYDAGDNVKFGYPMAFTVTLLGWSAVEYGAAVAAAGQLGGLRAAIRWGADFLLRAHASPTTLYTQLFDFANNYRGSFQSSCPFYCSYSGFQDELLWASAWLFKATRDAKYLDFLTNNQGSSNPVNEFSWDSKYAGAQMLAAQEYLGGRTALARYKDNLDSFVCALMPNSGNVQIRTTPGGLLFTRDSVNLQYTTTATLVLSIYSKVLKSSGSSGVRCSARTFSPDQISSFATSQVDYILGKNPLGMSYMVGFSTKFPRRIHHRGASVPSIKVLSRKVTCKEGFSSWLPTSDPNPNIHVGAIVGGPDGNDQFSDNRGDPSHSEPATYINAAFVGACAAAMGQKQGVKLDKPVDNLASMVSTY